ncbi:MAG: hypothetical protein N2515_11135, partial [Deltaproteobacteria bacterium]|nr:hypothetical protein [Deltaproteobacteria bacterium]
KRQGYVSPAEFERQLTAPKQWNGLSAQPEAPHWVIERAQSVMVQPSHGHPHRNHFHVRIYCAPDDRPFCQDSAPFHPWYPRLPRENTLPHPPTQEDALE